MINMRWFRAPASALTQPRLIREELPFNARIWCDYIEISSVQMGNLLNWRWAITRAIGCFDRSVVHGPGKRNLLTILLGLISMAM